MFRKYLIGVFLLLVTCSHASAEDCITRTGSNATIILPSDLASNLKSGDRISARFKGLCIGQTTYREGNAVALTIWGDDDMTGAVDGAPEGKPFALAVTRAGTGVGAMEAAVTFEGREAATYYGDAILVAQRLEIVGRSGGASSIGAPLAVEAVTASSYEDPNAPAHVIDGDAATRWSARGKRQWLRLDLGQRQRLGAIEVAWFRGERRRASFEVELSDDGQRWERAFAGASSGETSEPERYALSGSARFVRLVGLGNSDNRWNSITEIVLHGATAEPEAPLAIAGTSASSYEDPNAPAHVIDGDAATRWSARGKRQWLRLDLGQRQRLGAIEVAWFRGERRRASFEVELSDDGQRWERAFAGASSGETSEPERYALSGSARFVRLVGLGNSDNNWNAATEVRLYGEGAAQASASALAKAAPSEAAHSASKFASQGVPDSYALDQNYPNPFNPSTTIAYRLPKASKVTLTIYDAAGRRVRQLVSRHQQAGEYRVRWDGRDATGAQVGSGLYAYQIEAETFRRTRTMVLVK